MDQYIGKMLDNRYEILERIGTGGMAVVYKAKCHRLNRLVAVKILKEDLAQDADFRRRFNAESQAVAQLSHPNIMSVYDVSRGGDTEYIVMELIDGITLKQYMEKRKQLNWREALHFITQIMRGLSHAHSRGIVHRDIKPQNIMVLRDGSIRVADFGIACLENSAQTLTQEALGSVHYISPEQARGDRTDARSDIYSAGIVLYEMLAGRLPFEGDSAVSVAIQHLSSIPLMPREINSEIPEPLELICMKAMASDPERRYASADAMIVDLEAFRKNPDVDLDFELEDIRKEEIDEPTRPLRIAGAAAVATNNQLRRDPKANERRAERRYEDYDDDSGSKDKKQIILIIVASVLALALIGVMFKSIFGSFEQQASNQYAVPSVLGMLPDEAKEMENIKDIFVIEIQEDTFYSTEYEAGEIVKQDPEEGTFRKGENAVIKVWLSAGEDTGVMIDVSKQTVAEAKTNLKNLINRYDLVIADILEEEKEFNDEIEEGKILRTDPPVGAQLQKGDTIRFILSKGPELQEFAMPDFVGKNIDVVLEQLQTTWKLTCEPEDIEEKPSTEPEGEILWQSIPETTVVKEGDIVKFQISTGLSQPSKEFAVMLPQDGRDEVLVEVYVGEETVPQYSEPHTTMEPSVRVRLTGTDTQLVKVFIDGVQDEYQTHYLQFS